MASSEGQTELLTGWSCVVHQPAEDPEPADLPSTVDITAFSAGLPPPPAAGTAPPAVPVAPATASTSTTVTGVVVSSSTTTTPAQHSASESDSDSESHGSGSGSCSQSDSADSSDTDDSSSSSSSSARSPSPEFSVTTQPASAGLRMTIATVRKPPSPLPPDDGSSGSSDEDDGDSSSDSSDSAPEEISKMKSTVVLPPPPPPPPPASTSTRSVRPRRSVVEQQQQQQRQRRAPPPTTRKTAEKEKEKETTSRVLRERGRAKRKKIASMASRSPGSSSSSPDSDADSVMLSTCSLQEIRQEDLAAILPDQQECDAFDAFEEGAKRSLQPPGGDASASDIELPQQAVNAIIQRTTDSYSESESHHAPPPSGNLFANSLIQQFHIVQGGGPGGDKQKNTAAVVAGGVPGKRQRGRPKKIQRPPPASARRSAAVEVVEYGGDPNVSPDSGIQNSPDHVSSPECSPRPMKQKNGSAPTTKKTKLTVTSNRFDRILYGHSDRVLYPPRRKVGRPVSKKGPGRPPKNKPTESATKPKQQVKQEAKSKEVQIIAKSKEKTTHLNDICERISKRLGDHKTRRRDKYLTFKNEKLMHSRHKHNKHKKCKIKILKPLPAVEREQDGKLNAEVEKLVADFVRLCAICPPKPEAATLKKVSKKRKASDYNERKKKKVVAAETTSPNEQRLPLKKRHYHVSSSTSTTQAQAEENALDATPSPVEQDKDKSLNNNNVPETITTTTKKKKTHVDEAIEACINKYAIKKDKAVAVEEMNVEEKPMMSPKKRHCLENFPAAENTDAKEAVVDNMVNEMKMKRSLSSAGKKNNDVMAALKKKNNLDELTSNLSSKLLQTDIKRRKDDASGKFPTCKKARPLDSKDLETAVDEKPTGIFMPTVDLETLVPETASKVNIKEVKRKVRKRRAINRTGFPTVKKKKKKPPVPVATTPVTTPTIPSLEQKPVPTVPACDRVPKEGEEYTTFVERTISPPCPEPEMDLDEDDEVCGVKWEVMSECDSLPMEDRIDFDLIKSEQLSQLSHNRDESPMTISSVDEASGTKLRSKSRLSKFKHLQRDTSPASRDSSASGDDIAKRARRAPRWRKKYLPAGLFSDYFKDEAGRRAEVPKKMQYVPEEHPYGLLPAPYHCGKYLRCRKIPFQLPHDLWWQHTHSQLPGRDIVPSWNYRKIRANVYNVKNTLIACEPQACNCSPTANCGDDCINRLVLAECPATHKCNNQRIQKHEWAPGLEKFMTEQKGWGVRTNQPIRNGEFILEYVGEVVSDQEFKERMASRYAHDTHHYCLHLDGGLVIDGHRMGGDGRFVNHSCAPNCEIQKWSVNGQFRMALFSLRDIEAGEELTYDYNFTLFNPADGQECKCGSEDCRGVIGGKSQRVRLAQAQLVQTLQNASAAAAARVGRPRKTLAKKAAGASIATPIAQTPAGASAVVPQAKISGVQQAFIKEHHCFLLRNLKRNKKLRERSCSGSQTSTSTTATPTNQSAAFLNQLNALRQPRNMITRRVAQAEDDPELKRAVRLANLLRDIYNVVAEAKSEDGTGGEKLCTPFILCPSKRKLPEYYQKITEPIDLTTIEQNITSGLYKTLDAFDVDMNRLFNNAIKYYGRSTDEGVACTKLKKVYSDAKKTSWPEIENVLGVRPPAKNTSKKKKGGGQDEEDIIRCICGMYRDEGLMIQCERCLVWQHCECVNADVNAASYHCEKCVPREVDYEIPLDEFTEHGHRYYMTLMRGELQLRQGDTVYVLRDIAIAGTEKKHTYQTIGEVNYSDLDIFRIERLWKDSQTGQRFAYGHHYLRPHETYHEPTRKFFTNEVMRVPLYEAVPVELIITHCWVMDLNTYCKGRPIGAPEQHVYICEYRVDKNARLFSRVAKSKFPVCCKSYAFERFAERLKVTRTYTPHDLDPAFTKQRGRKPHETSSSGPVVSTSTVADEPLKEQRVYTFADKKARVDGILLKLLSKLPTKQALDVSYLLEGGRRRKNRQEKTKDEARI